MQINMHIYGDYAVTSFQKSIKNSSVRNRKIKSCHPESNQGPSDFCKFYNQMPYLLSYSRLYTLDFFSRSWHTKPRHTNLPTLKSLMTAVGFEPTQLALVELGSTPLDHSGKLSVNAVQTKVPCLRAHIHTPPPQ